MTPEPGPRPTATLGCFAALVAGLFAFVIFGPSLGRWIVYPVVIGALVGLVYILVRILARRR